jgi:hypothetical protein
MSFRCNEFGHICDGMPPRREAPNNDLNATVSYGVCTSNERDAYLLPVRDTANRIKSLKADDGQIMLAAITGPAAPYVVTWEAPASIDTSCGATSCVWPKIGHSCTAADGSFGDPAVRIAELAGHFGANGKLLSICDDDFAPALGNVASNIAAYVKAPCILGRVAKRSGTSYDDCTVVDSSTGNRVPSCDESNGVGACWRLVPGGDTCAGVSVTVQADPQGTDDPPGNLTVECRMCIAGTPEPALGCP